VARDLDEDLVHDLRLDREDEDVDRGGERAVVGRDVGPETQTCSAAAWPPSSSPRTSASAMLPPPRKPIVLPCIPRTYPM
jgi:hypothetical protein